MREFTIGLVVGLLSGITAMALFCAESALSQSSPYPENPTNGYQYRGEPTTPKYGPDPVSPSPYTYGGKPC